MLRGKKQKQIFLTYKHMKQYTGCGFRLTSMYKGPKPLVFTNNTSPKAATNNNKKAVSEDECLKLQN